MGDYRSEWTVNRTCTNAKAPRNISCGCRKKGMAVEFTSAILLSRKLAEYAGQHAAPAILTTVRWSEVTNRSDQKMMQESAVSTQSLYQAGHD
jgi:hypothetical protein